jgi:hypothetical protein
MKELPTMAHINIHRFYNEIVSRGRRNVPTYAETRRDASELAERVGSVGVYGAN